jgi:hypothetical protein
MKFLIFTRYWPICNTEIPVWNDTSIECLKWSKLKLRINIKCHINEKKNFLSRKCILILEWFQLISYVPRHKNLQNKIEGQVKFWLFIKRRYIYVNWMLLLMEGPYLFQGVWFINIWERPQGDATYLSSENCKFREKLLKHFYSSTKGINTTICYYLEWPGFMPLVVFLFIDIQNVGTYCYELNATEKIMQQQILLF